MALEAGTILRMASPPEDMTAAARIRNAALEGFADRGVAATSIRWVAAAAGVSPGLVQYHYPTKEALREAVDRYVLEVAASTFSDLPLGVSASDVAEELGKRITALFRDRPLGLRYVARGLIDRDEHALALFDNLVKLTGRIAAQDISDGRMWPDIDPVWASLHVLIYNLAAILLEEAIDRQLPEPLRSEEGLERWRTAATALFRHGLYRPDHT
jgi:AcrR family transcriptional regulator